MCFQQESGTTGFAVDLTEPESKKENIIMNPNQATPDCEEDVSPISMPVGCPQVVQQYNAVPDTCEVICLH
jgi:hypothetical protein